ncbi:MAG: SDR family NAD(P)-dependent oxidoreductase [Dehalococcoidia bacterium]
MQLSGKTALVSGSSRNIGKATALAFAREGSDLILVARETGDELEQVAAECEALGVRALPLLADVGDHEQVNAMVKKGLDHFGQIDILVCNAAIRPHQPFWEISYEDWHRVFAVNLHSAFYLAKAVTPGMMERGHGGSIIAMGGLASVTSQPLRAHVVASKTGLYGLIKSMALELGPYGIRANLIAVGVIDTERRHPEWYPEADGQPQRAEGVVQSTPLRRAGSPQEVADVALFLASDNSSFVTGDRIICAGGMFM